MVGMTSRATTDSSPITFQDEHDDALLALARSTVGGELSPAVARAALHRAHLTSPEELTHLVAGARALLQALQPLVLRVLAGIETEQGRRAPDADAHAVAEEIGRVGAQAGSVYFALRQRSVGEHFADRTPTDVASVLGLPPGLGPNRSPPSWPPRTRCASWYCSPTPRSTWQPRAEGQRPPSPRGSA